MVISDKNQSIYSTHKIHARPYSLIINKSGLKIWEGKPSDLTDNLLKRLIASERRKVHLNLKITDIVQSAKKEIVLRDTSVHIRQKIIVDIS